MIATHLLDAFRAEPDDADAAEIKQEAREWLDPRSGTRSGARGHR